MTHEKSIKLNLSTRGNSHEFLQLHKKTAPAGSQLYKPQPRPAIAINVDEFHTNGSNLSRAYVDRGTKICLFKWMMHYSQSLHRQTNKANERKAGCCVFVEESIGFTWEYDCACIHFFDVVFTNPYSRSIELKITTTQSADAHEHRAYTGCDLTSSLHSIYNFIFC